jgi:hypothetical protein
MPATTEEERHLASVDEPKARSIEDMADDAEEPEEPKEVPPTQLSLPGTRERITDKAGGGVSPDESELRVVGARRPIVGQFEWGEPVTLLVNATISGVHFEAPSDDWGQTKRRVRIHKARQTHVRHATAEALVRELANLGLSRQEVAVLYDEVVAE